MRTHLIIGSILAAAVFGTAQARQPNEDVEANLVEELVVRARTPGPAWWRVSDADSTVFVLGLPETSPTGLSWDQSVLRRRLQGSNGLITPPVMQASANLFTLPKLLFDARRASRSRTEIGDRIPAALAARLERAAIAAGEPSDTFDHAAPWFAGVRLAARWRRRAGLTEREPLATIRRLARDAGVKAAPADIARGKASALVQDLKTISDAVSRRCVEAVVAEVEAGPVPVRAAAQAWASGDVRAVLDRPRSFELCFALLPGAGAAKRDSLDLQADAVAAALQRPGHTVAALSLRSLVAQGGVLARLRAKGLTVQTPD